MNFSSLDAFLSTLFKDKSLYGFSAISKQLSDETGCCCSLVTLQPFPNLKCNYNPVEFYGMLEDLRVKHSQKLNQVKMFLDNNQIKYALPSAAPKNNGELLADFSYKWAAINAGLGFIGKNDVFVHHKYAQRVRISCLLLDVAAPVFSGEIESKCGSCKRCVKACPHGFITGNTWRHDGKRDDLIDYKKCATKSNHDREGQKYLCAACVMACTYSE